MSCAGQKLSLWVLAKGPSVHCERNFKLCPRVTSQHSESGWATKNVISVFIEELHQEIADCKPCAFILDIYRSDRTKRVRGAEENDMEFFFLWPVGQTDYSQ
jgi:hypothetical protein